MRARVRTLGIEEHHFVIEKGKRRFQQDVAYVRRHRLGLDAGMDLYVTDAGGTRSLVSLHCLGRRETAVNVYQACKMGALF